MIGLIIWNIILTLALALAVLAGIGKFSRLEREVFENLENLRGGFWGLQTDFKNLVTKVKTLEENHTYDNSTLAGSMEQIENRIAQLQETQNTLVLNEKIARQDINLLLSADKEHPVLAPVSKGGRPRKGEL